MQIVQRTLLVIVLLLIFMESWHLTCTEKEEKIFITKDGSKSSKKTGDSKYLLVNKNNDYGKIYQNYFIAKRQILKDFCAKFDCKYRQIRTDLPIFQQLKPL